MASVTGEQGLGQEIDGQATALGLFVLWGDKDAGTEQQVTPAHGPRHHRVRTRCEPPGAPWQVRRPWQVPGLAN